MIKPNSVFCFAIGVCAFVMAATPAAAELLVSGATGLDNVRTGAKFSDDTVFKLPANAELKLLRSSDNTPFVMRGPFEGTLSNYIASCNGYLAALHSYCKSSAGDGPPVGATRGIRRPDSQ
jgi:hypothetical protein